MKAKTYSVVTNGEEFRIVDNESGEFHLYLDPNNCLGLWVPKPFKTHDEALKEATHLSWVPARILNFTAPHPDTAQTIPAESAPTDPPPAQPE